MPSTPTVRVTVFGLASRLKFARLWPEVLPDVMAVDWVLPLYRFVHSALMVEPSGAFSDSVAHRKALKPSASGMAT